MIKKYNHHMRSRKSYGGPLLVSPSMIMKYLVAMSFFCIIIYVFYYYYSSSCLLSDYYSSRPTTFTYPAYESPLFTSLEQQQPKLLAAKDFFMSLDRQSCRHVKFHPIEVPTPRPLVDAPVYYLTAKFTDGTRSFQSQLQRFGCRVLQSHVFDHDRIFVAGDTFPLHLLNEDQRHDFQQHLKFLTNSSHASKRGAGYWFWKPFLILHVLQNIVPDDAYLVYSDPDRPDVLIYTADVLEAMVQRQHDFAIEQWIHAPERQWTKGDIFHAFNITDYNNTIASSTQSSANYIIMKKNEHIVRLIELWLRMISEYHLVSDEPSVIMSDHQKFHKNRHDQSLMSMIIKVLFLDGGISKTIFEYFASS